MRLSACGGQVHSVVVGETKPVFYNVFFLTRIVLNKIFNDLGQRCRYAFFVHNNRRVNYYKKQKLDNERVAIGIAK